MKGGNSKATILLAGSMALSPGGLPAQTNADASGPILPSLQCQEGKEISARDISQFIADYVAKNKRYPTASPVLEGGNGDSNEVVSFILMGGEIALSAVKVTGKWPDGRRSRILYLGATDCSLKAVDREPAKDGSLSEVNYRDMSKLERAESASFAKSYMDGLVTNGKLCSYLQTHRPRDNPR